MSSAVLPFALSTQARHRPALPVSGVAPWLAVSGLSSVMLLLVLLIASPGLFPVVLPLLLLALALAVLAGIASLIEPPRWTGIGLIMLAFAMMDASLRKGGVHAGAFDVQSILKGLVWLLVLVYAAIHGLRALPRHPLLLLLATYCCFAFLSALYSKTRLLGLGSGIALLAIAAYAGVISRWHVDRLDRLWRALFATVAGLALLSLIAYFAAPAWARDYLASGAGRLRGVTGSGNSLGPILCIGLIAGTYTLAAAPAAARVIRVLLMTMMFACLLLTESRGATLGLVAAFVVLASLAHPLRALASTLVALIVAWALAQPDLLDAATKAFAQLFSRSGSVFEITSFTGRSDIWAAVLPKWLESPWIGYGLGSPRLIVSQAYTGPWGQTYESAHNWLLESLISFGLVGTTMLIVFLTSMFAAAWRLRRQLRLQAGRARETALVTAVLRCGVFLIVSGLVDKSFAGMPSPPTVLLALMAGTCAALRAPQDAVPPAAGTVP